MKKIVIAVDSFKGSLSSIQAADCIEAGIRRVEKEADIVKIPAADGGEGTARAFAAACGGRICSEKVAGPLGSPVCAEYAILPDGTAVLEMAQAAGLTLTTPNRRSALRAGTYGVGELIRKALDQGCRRLILGLGGSASTDGGAGMAQALGVRLRDRNGAELPLGGEALLELAFVDCSGLDPRIRECRIVGAADVTNPLCGPEGAAAVYGPQKGAGPREAALLDRALSHYADVLEDTLGKKIRYRPGAGAAGGLGMGMMAFLGARLRPGIDLLLDAAGFEEQLKGAELVITGEGRLDAQTLCGKTPAGVAARTKRYGDIPVLALAGSLGEGAEAVYESGIDGICPIVDRPMTLAEAVAGGERLLTLAAGRLFRIWRIKRNGEA